jgi:uncharacterized membrane protein
LLNNLYTEDVPALPISVDEEPFSLRPAEARMINAPRPGYLQAIDYTALVQTAQAHALVIKLERMVGDFVARDSPLLSIWPGEQVSQAFMDDLYSAFDIGTERTMFDDVLFGIRQLVDIALKAISPAVNDPTTAVNCIDYLSNLLIQAAHHPDPPGQYTDTTGKLRLIAPRPTFAMLLDLAFDQIRHYSRQEVTITLRLLAALTEIAQATSDPERQTELWRHACMISRNVDSHIREPLERRQINDYLHQLAMRTGGQAQMALLAVDAKPQPEPDRSWLSTKETSDG